MRLNALGFYQNNIKRFSLILGKMLAERKNMRGVEIGRAPNMARGISVISNPFKGVGSYIENKGPSLLGSRVGIIKNPGITRIESKIGKFREFGGFSGAKRAEAERIITVARKPAVLERRAPVPVLVRFPNPILTPKVEVRPQIKVQQRAENRTTTRVVRTTSAPTQRVVQTEHIVEEKKVVTERKQSDKPQSKKSEKAVTRSFKIVEAVKVTEARKHAIIEAVKRTKEKTGSINVKGILEHLSVEFWKHISPLVGNSGKDGTINLTLKAIAASPARYDSLEEAQRGLSRFVEEHIPLEKGEGSRVATIEEVREVLEGKEKENLKSQALSEIVIKRVVRKNVNTVVEEKEEVVGEATLKSLGLVDLFPKAA